MGIQDLGAIGEFISSVVIVINCEIIETGNDSWRFKHRE